LYSLLGVDEQKEDDEAKAIANFIAGSLALLQMISPAVNRITEAVGNFRQDKESIEGKVAKFSTIGHGKGESPVAIAKEAIRTSLEDVYGAFIKRQEKLGHGQKPIVVLVDELDRCRPDYAIELLERIKHLFSVNGYVFVFALARDQLEKSVGHRYGEKFDASGYLERFFDFRFGLPDPDLAEYFDFQITKTRLPEGKRCAAKYLKSFVTASPDGFGLSLRVLDKMIVDLSSLIALVEDDSDVRIWALFLAMGVLAQKTNPDWFKSYYTTDDLLVHAVLRPITFWEQKIRIQYNGQKYNYIRHNSNNFSWPRLFVCPPSSSGHMGERLLEGLALYVDDEVVTPLSAGDPFFVSPNRDPKNFSFRFNAMPEGNGKLISSSEDFCLKKYSDIRHESYQLVCSLKKNSWEEGNENAGKTKEPS